MSAPTFRESHPNYDINVRNARFFESGDLILLHHACESMQAATDTPYWIRGQNWWACHETERPLDDDACFELYCDACFKRWAAEDPRDRSPGDP